MNYNASELSRISDLNRVDGGKMNGRTNAQSPMKQRPDRHCRYIVHFLSPVITGNTANIINTIGDLRFRSLYFACIYRKYSTRWDGHQLPSAPSTQPSVPGYAAS